LHYTHERTDDSGKLLGIVHRDVSPHNVFLTYGGEVKIVDFGIAKVSTQLSRTRTGVLKGKVAYMAPEQAMGQPLDRRSDVYCIGILLWEMTTGRWLFRRRTELDTLNAVAGERPPRPSRVAPSYPRDLDKLVMKTLSRSREKRWATAAELIDAIDELARRRRLVLGPGLVSDLMVSVFVDEFGAWRAARSAGTSLGDHLVEHEPAVVPAADEDDELPEPALGTPLPRVGRPRRRRLWPAVVAGTAVAGIAAAGIAIHHHRGSASPPAPVPAAAQAAAPSTASPSGPAASATASATPAATPATASPAATPAIAPASLATAPPAAGTAATTTAAPARPEETSAAPHGMPERPATHRPAARTPTGRPGPANKPPGADAVRRDEPAAAPKQPSAPRKPTIEELDRLP
jgi:hypothetical protein